MHLWAIFSVILTAWMIRTQSMKSKGTWSERWYTSLFLLLFPALLILSTAIAILYMGCHGAMLGIKAGSWGCSVAAILILFAVTCLVKLVDQSRHSTRNLAIYPRRSIEGTFARIIDLDLPYSAQIGFWQPELVITSGLFNSLDQEHLTAVLAHEQAHLYYRDTFWFFWLGWMRSFTFWLPNTEALWQELLLLRELRADSKAAEEVDFLLLAESLLTVAQAPLKYSPGWCANFNDYALGDRLNERIDSLLGKQKPPATNQWRNWSWVCLLVIPLLTIPLHY
ncbi:M56 family metallopeptidase [Waterburya agarophytonicola K14]|uniref:M56 family metallopeptidase n=1 Tax=Waterburya agarophytonicola KI4 TaxID=2874699 RepID=A0A964BNF6_9CYAN|nr:M56 family metallopeptidase [Waterburya agarophytonicola]MCC0176644.1 M56 family metallopeptidase [Waterburya agarophytonicola KI4]